MLVGVLIGDRSAEIFVDTWGKAETEPCAFVCVLQGPQGTCTICHKLVHHIDKQSQGVVI